MRDDFCIFILSHKRPTRVQTYTTLRRAGYSGRLYIVVDDQDPTLQEYQKLFGDKVLVFSKSAIAPYVDVGDNFYERHGAVVYARNACFELARKVGCRYFLQLDDDYTYFALVDRYGKEVVIKSHFDRLIESFLEFFMAIPAHSIALAQTGDYIGGKFIYTAQFSTKRKVMNSFFCSTDRVFSFYGRLNEDVNMYVTEGHKGKLFLTVLGALLHQNMTQTNPGGLTELYLDLGTYAKSFYSVMYCPSVVEIAVMQSHVYKRIHHQIVWDHAAPKIIPERFRK